MWDSLDKTKSYVFLSKRFNSFISAVYSRCKKSSVSVSECWPRDLDFNITKYLDYIIILYSWDLYRIGLLYHNIIYRALLSGDKKFYRLRNLWNNGGRKPSDNIKSMSPYRDREFDENAILTLLSNGVTTLILRYYGLFSL